MMRSLILSLFMTACVWPSVGAAQDAEEPVRPALLVIDVQNEFLPMMDAAGQDMAVRIINGAIWLFRQNDLPVIPVYHTDPQWGPDPDSEGFRFPESIQVTDEDPRIVKNHPSAFVATELDDLLRDRQVNTLFLCGLSSTGCVLATYFGAQERSYDTFLVEGALMGPDAELTDAVCDIVTTLDWTGLEVLLRAVSVRK